MTVSDYLLEFQNSGGQTTLIFAMSSPKGKEYYNNKSASRPEMGRYYSSFN